MTDQQWSQLLHRVPEDAQNALMLALHNGTTIAVQDFLRVDEHFILLRGRVAGTSDTGQMFCLPYDKLLYACLTRPLPEQVVVGIFGELLHGLVDAGSPLETAEQPPPPAPELPPMTPPPLTPPPLSPSSTGGANLASLRERLRAKLTGSGGEPKKP